MLTVPLKAVPEVARELAPRLSGKVVLDTGNAYERRDGEVAHQASAHPQIRRVGRRHVSWRSVGEGVQLRLFQDAGKRGAPRGRPGQESRIASDVPAALETAAALVRDAGFDPVIVGPLARGKEFEPNTPPYNTGMSGPELRALLQLTNQ